MKQFIPVVTAVGYYWRLPVGLRLQTMSVSFSPNYVNAEMRIFLMAGAKRRSVSES